MHQRPQTPTQSPPPIDLPLWHRFLRTQDLLWLSREAGEALIVLAEALAAPEPKIVGPEGMLGMAVLDLHHCFIDLEFLDEDEAPHWGPLGAAAFETRPVLGEMIEHLLRLVPVDLSGVDSCLNPVRALYGQWAEPQIVAALGTVGARVVVDQHETSDLPSMVDDPLYCLAAGLICDLPFLGAVLRQVGGTPLEWRQTLILAADQLEAESRRLFPLLPPLPVSAKP
jgi:hypothetical protein